jgi:hypothetical protein|mmetsp:Transcript_13071/g.17650  ORF Transcript_13071/g.17650 Transcript_13071/m.17650 type:complete len:88 (+) Transcript_13071:298-561(+)
MIDDDDDEEYPVYPHTASIFLDVRNGYDIVYDPHYEPAQDYSHYDRMFLGESDESPQHAQMHHAAPAPHKPAHGHFDLNQEPMLEED